MPRENIKSMAEQPDYVAPQVDVSWGRDTMSVQLATTHVEPSVVEWMGERLAEVEITEEQRSAVTAALVGPHSGAQGWYVSLDRYGINKLIRILRKARDQSFGADA